MASTSGIKVFAYFLHILCTLLALVLISFGIYVLVTYDPNEIGSYATYAYIGVGAAAIIIFLWGYLAAWRENVCCTVTFVTLLYMVILLQLAALIILTYKNNAVASNLTNALDKTWDEEINNPGAMSLYENWFHCCGHGSAQDYIVNERLPPTTCFKDHDKSKTDGLYMKGCRIEFEDYWMNMLFIFNIIGWVLIAIELLLSIVSYCLCNSIRNDSRRSRY